MSEKWKAQAACAGMGPTPDFYHYDHEDRAEPGGPSRTDTYDEARKVCDRCPVVAECLAYALEKPERFGFWGGKSPVERKEILSARRRAAQAAGD